MRRVQPDRAVDDGYDQPPTVADALTITGSVCLADGRSPLGASVTANWSGGAVTEACGETGTFRVRVPGPATRFTDGVAVVVERLGYRTRIVRGASGVLDVGRVVLEPSFAYHGTVRDASGSPIRGATVFVARGGATVASAAVSAAADGAFSIDTLPDFEVAAWRALGTAAISRGGLELVVRVDADGAWMGVPLSPDGFTSAGHDVVLAEMRPLLTVRFRPESRGATYARARPVELRVCSGDGSTSHVLDRAVTDEDGVATLLWPAHVVAGALAISRDDGVTEVFFVDGDRASGASTLDLTCRDRPTIVRVDCNPAADVTCRTVVLQTHYGSVREQRAFFRIDLGATRSASQIAWGWSPDCEPSAGTWMAWEASVGHTDGTPLFSAGIGEVQMPTDWLCSVRVEGLGSQASRTGLLWLAVPQTVRATRMLVSVVRDGEIHERALFSLAETGLPCADGRVLLRTTSSVGRGLAERVDADLQVELLSGERRYAFHPIDAGDWALAIDGTTPLVLRPADRRSGVVTVLDSAGRPAPHVSVGIAPARGAGRHAVYSTRFRTSDADGTLSLPPLLPGVRYVLYAELPGSGEAALIEFVGGQHPETLIVRAEVLRDVDLALHLPDGVGQLVTGSVTLQSAPPGLARTRTDTIAPGGTTVSIPSIHPHVYDVRVAVVARALSPASGTVTLCGEASLGDVVSRGISLEVPRGQSPAGGVGPR